MENSMTLLTVLAAGLTVSSVAAAVLAGVAVRHARRAADPAFFEETLAKILGQLLAPSIAPVVETSLTKLRGAISQELREIERAQEQALRYLALDLTQRIDQGRAETLRHLGQDFQQIQQSLVAALGASREQQIATTRDLERRVQEGLQEIQAQTSAKLDQVRDVTQNQLNEMRATVEEKLQSTLERRLGESFRTVSDRLEQVHKGLGEMQTLATGVGDLKKVLTNVRTRGTYGEVQLQTLLEQILVPSQYDKNIATVPGSSERVEFAVRLPGDDDGKPVYLPIDSKFPTEDYERLVTAHNASDLVGVEEATRALRRRILDEAEKILKKYVSPPHTTDIALLFLPTEGLYAEVLRYPGMLDELHGMKVVPCGPSTLYAVLNSIHLGFRTLALQKRSHEVWNVLGAVKTEFGKFGDVLSKVKEKLDQASRKISETEVRTRQMERALRGVESMPEAKAAVLVDQLAPPLLGATAFPPLLSDAEID